MTLYSDEFDANKLIFSFWSLLAEQTVLEAGQALTNLDIPFYLSNAVWQPDLINTGLIKHFYENKNLPPALIVSALKTPNLEAQLEHSPFEFECSFVLREAHLREAQVTETVVEQVSWSQMRYASQILANHYEQPELTLTLSKQLSEAMQKHPQINAFIAYNTTSSEPVGTMITHETNSSLTAHLLIDKDGSLEQRLHTDAKHQNKSAFVLEQLPESTKAATQFGLERWSI